MRAATQTEVLDEALLRDLSNRYTGLFRRGQALPPRAGEPALHLHGGEVPASGGRAQELVVGGAGLSAGAARRAAVGEAIERLRAHRLPRDAVRRASYAHFAEPEPALDPRRLVLFHEEQHAQPGFPFAPLLPTTETEWLCCREAGSGLPLWVPAEVCYLFSAGAHHHAPGLSTGLCCGAAGDGLLLRGAQEVIERDAVVGAWWGRYPLRELPAQALLTTQRALAEALDRPNLRYRCYQVDTPLSSGVVVCTVDGEGPGGYAFAVGSACRETLTASLRKALIEAVQSLRYARALKDELRAGRRPPLPQASAGRPPQDFAEHALYYSLYPQALRGTPLDPDGPEAALRRDGLTASGAGRQPDPLTPHRGPDSVRGEQAQGEQNTLASGWSQDGAGAEAPEDLAALRARLGPARPVLFCDLTPPELLQRARGRLRVLRVLIPGLQPLHGDDRLPLLGGPLWGRPVREFAALAPHPYP